MTQRRVGENINKEYIKMKTFNDASLQAYPISEIGVNIIKGIFNTAPQSVKMQIGEKSNLLYVKLKFNYGKCETNQHSMKADHELVKAMILAMKGNTDALNSYDAKKHTVQTTAPSTLVKMAQELSIELDIRVANDYVAQSGTIYKHIIFPVTEKNYTEMYLPNTPITIQSLNAIQQRIANEQEINRILNSHACNTDVISSYDNMGNIANL
ncbi:MAG: hypothetical protein NC405_08935 [Odoribacter sp.]|nr:hypothetical protein [Odoribacter sp.]